MESRGPPLDKANELQTGKINATLKQRSLHSAWTQRGDKPPKDDRENFGAVATQKGETLSFNNMYSIMTIGQIRS